MPAIVVDPDEIAAVVADRGEESFRDEVWDGVLVMPPMPNDEHQQVQLALCVPLFDLVQRAGLGEVRPGVNVSDRAAGWRQNYRSPDAIVYLRGNPAVNPGWRQNYRSPDAIVYLRGNPAVNHGSHWQGGPDLLAEILSPGEDAAAKFGFYAGIGTREVLVVDRYPWAVELFRLTGGAMASIGRAEEGNGVEVTSGVVPLAFRLVAGLNRPVIEIRHTGTGQTWTA